METTLNQLCPGQNARVLAIHTEAALRRRLFDHGLIEGTQLRCLQRKARGATAIFLVRGSMLALRGSDSRRILVELLP
ncbi:MAG: ferrous iron transport protein A [Oscillospiraceae bacterium]|nr:ferrous iron transport protein A [Oscillospiraceae bacterium]